MLSFDVNNNVSIENTENRKMFNALMEKGIISYGTPGDEYSSSRVFNAAPAVTTPNVNVPLGAMNYIFPQDIEIRTAIKTADKIATRQKIGEWGGSKMITIKVKEFNGQVTPDDGFANSTSRSTVNYSYITRGVFPFAGYWGNTDMGRTTAAAFGEDLKSDDVASLMSSLAIAQNQIFFTGVKEKNLKTVGVDNPVYGLLNEPNLDGYNTVANNGIDPSGNKSTYWEYKTVNQIYNDVLIAYKELINKSGGNIVSEGISSLKGKIKLAISLGTYYLLKTVQSTGTQWISAYELIKNNLGLQDEDIIPVPQFNGAYNNEDVFYLIYEETGVYGPTILNIYQELIRAYPIFQQHSEISQKIASQVSGCIVRYPMFVTRYTGIGKSPKLAQIVY